MSWADRPDAAAVPPSSRADGAAVRTRSLGERIRKSVDQRASPAVVASASGVWSGKGVEESRAGLDNHIVAWTYDRPAGGRSFSFTGLDAHAAWELPGMRQLVVNGVLWSAGVSIPENGALNAVEKSTLDAMTTPRESKKPSTAASKKP